MSDEKNKEWTLRELAAETCVPERTIRFYISRGLVDPPLRGGRGAAYGEKHKARLETIRELQAKGMMLAEIAHALAAQQAYDEHNKLSSRTSSHLIAVPKKEEEKPAAGPMLWFEPDGSLDKSQLNLMTSPKDTLSPPMLPEPETWRSYPVAPDVRVMLRTGASPWRIKALMSALRRFAAEIDLETKREDKGE